MSILTKPIVTDKEICEYLRISQVTLWRMTKKQNFPEPITKGNRAGKKVREWLTEKGII